MNKGNLIKNNKNVMQIIDWLKKKYINLSRFVQEKIDEEMKKEKDRWYLHNQD